MQAIKRIAHELNIVVKYPVHPSPSVRGIVNSELRGLANVELLEPLEYIEFITLMKNACIILTDSGGIQEEAPSLGVPVWSSGKPQNVQKESPPGVPL